MANPAPVLPPDSIPALESERSPIFIRSATLVSRDATALARFYIEALGFSHLGGDAGEIALGAGDTVLLRIANRPEAKPFDPASAGLFHLAFLLPGRAGLARWFVAARAAGVRFEGASDHAVSEALYLSDPEGNGIEIYADRPRAVWPRDALGYAMTTGPLALRELVTLAGADEPAPPRLPGGTRLGHVHLQTGDTERDAPLWQAQFGLAETHRRPGARFLSWGGYHHHIALNQWRSHGAGPREAASCGLSAIEFAVREEDALARLAERTGRPVRQGRIEMSDPNGIVLRFRACRDEEESGSL